MPTVHTEHAIEDSLSSMKEDSFYPSHLFSMSDYYMPDSIKEIFRYCKYLALSDPIVSGAIHKLAEAPITEIMYEHENDEVKRRYKELFEQKMSIRERFLGAGFDLITYSNAFLSFHVPVQRYLISPNVAGASTEDHREFKKISRQVRNGQRNRAEFDSKYKDEIGIRNGRLPDKYKAENINWSLTGDGKFKGECPKTGNTVVFERQDRYYPSADNIKIKRWDPNRIEIHHNEITGENTYYYELKHATRKLIKKGNRDHYNSDPWQYIEAARQNRNVKIKKDQLYHLSNVKISGAFSGWGVPRLYSAFKLIFYYMTLLRSNESVARGKIEDLNILFPQSQSGMLDPVAAMPGSNFKRNVKSILENWRDNRNFVGISPIPVGNVSVFGEGRMQLISSEMEPILRMITTAMGIPFDMIFGGGKYSGMAVQQRLFSAQTGLHARRYNEALDFFQGKVSSMLGSDQYPPSMNMYMKDYEGPDDMQRKKTRAQAAMNEMLSISTFWEDQGLDPEQEWTKMEEDAKKMAKVQEIRAEGQARAQSEGQEIMQRSKMELQEEQMERQQEMKREMAAQQQGAGPSGPSAPEAGGEDLPPEKKQMAQEMIAMIQENPESKDQVLQYARAKHPDVFAFLQRKLQQQSGETPSGEAPSADLPYLDPGNTSGQESGSSSQQANSPVQVGMQNDARRPRAGQQAGGFMRQGDGMRPGGKIQDESPQPDQKPPRRESGGL